MAKDQSKKGNFVEKITDYVSQIIQRGDNMTNKNYELAPDFSLDDIEGVPVKLSNFIGKSNVVLVFNRGFM